MDPTYAVFCGIDVGKGEHHAVGLDPCSCQDLRAMAEENVDALR
ncbi:hypothetical protein L618_000100006390 [Rhodococcus rhodochrous J45]|uniref:Transposase n=1 Tax=Rhodococcus rhodochrous J45 TaxID=935266 RepID=A0A562ETU4_RHORH|nr:hypothetical protein [Rhodococcus rhodochrous]TWH25183.1 hypothetical protein L618_000100006390 [Rhodococcus rhodochrous J45]